jgi:hypothetical protein
MPSCLFKVENVKIKLSLFLNKKHYAMKANGGIAPPFFTSALDGGGQLHPPAALASGKEPPVPIG